MLSGVDPEVRDGGAGGRRARKERLYVCIQLIYFIVREKLTQHCKPIVLQKKKKKNVKHSHKKKCKTSLGMKICQILHIKRENQMSYKMPIGLTKDQKA